MTNKSELTNEQEGYILEAGMEDYYNKKEEIKERERFFPCEDLD